MNRYEIAEDLRNKPAEQLVCFNPHKSYFADGYKLTFTGIWKLTFKTRYIMSEVDIHFWMIISMYDFKPFEVIDEIGNDDRPVDFESEDIDINFLPSLGMDFESPPGAGHRTLRGLLGFVA